MSLAFFLFGILIIWSQNHNSVNGDCVGCTNLDEYSFAKVLPKFEVLLVKFDAQYPYGDKQEAFEEIAEELKNNDKLLVAQVGVKDYGARENEQFALKQGVNATTDIPQLKLYVRNKKPVDFPKTADWTADNIRKLLAEFTSIYIGFPGCYEKFDIIAARFLTATNKQNEIQVLEGELKSSTGDELASGKTYLQYMKKIATDGTEFISKENSRLGKILKDTKLKKEKVKELRKKLNILRSFTVPKDEL